MALTVSNGLMVLILYMVGLASFADLNGAGVTEEVHFNIVFDAQGGMAIKVEEKGNREERSAANDVMCGRSQVRTGRIKNGVTATVGEFPWLVSIRVAGPTGAHYCGGALIHHRFVLTAAHCVYRNLAKYVAVVAGAHDFNVEGPEPKQILTVKTIISHANFSKRYINDIALLELNEDAVWTKYVRPLCLPDSQVDGLNDPLDRLPVTVAGWGHTDEAKHGGKPSNVLQKVVVEVLPRATCQDWFQQETGKPVRLYDTHLCAGFETGEKDACKGDSGGPLMLRDDSGRQVAVGVVSAGIGCGRPKVPGLYTRVSRYISWINDNLRAAGFNGINL